MAQTFFRKLSLEPSPFNRFPNGFQKTPVENFIINFHKLQIRKRVRFPPPPPFFREKALEIRGLFLFDLLKISLSKRFPQKLFSR